MSKQRVLLPGDLIQQDFWKLTPFTHGQAFIDLFILTSSNTLTVDQSYFSKRWGWNEQNLIQEFLEHEYCKKHFDTKIEDEFYIINRKNQQQQKTPSLNREDLVDDLAGKILLHFNEKFGTGYRNAAAWLKNLEYWAGYYSEEEIMSAINRARADDFWGDKMTPIILFRRKNNKGEDTDYIGQLLNKKVRDGRNLFDKVMQIK